jgi:hypothetical protein
MAARGRPWGLLLLPFSAERFVGIHCAAMPLRRAVLLTGCGVSWVWSQLTCCGASCRQAVEASAMRGLYCLH